MPTVRKYKKVKQSLAFTYISNISCFNLFSLANGDRFCFFIATPHLKPHSSFMTWYNAIYMELHSYFNKQFSVYFAFFPVYRFLCVWSENKRCNFHRASVATNAHGEHKFKCECSYWKGNRTEWKPQQKETKTKKNQNKSLPLWPLDRPICCVKHHVLMAWREWSVFSIMCITIAFYWNKWRSHCLAAVLFEIRFVSHWAAMASLTSANRILTFYDFFLRSHCFTIFLWILFEFNCI